jgi:TP901 family phage tail tape measure protein
MAIRGGDIISYLELDKSRYSATLKAAQAEAAVFAKENATLGQKAQGMLNIVGAAGKGLTAGLSVPIAGVAAASGQLAIDFESAFAGVRKTVDATEAEFARLRASVLEMGRVVPKAHGELASYMETAGQLGVPQAQLEKFTRTIADLDVATNLAGEAGASMLAQYANVTGMDLSNIDRLGSVIVDLGNNTATTELDIVNMGQRLAGMAGILRLTDAQTMGLAATMASLGINAEAGGSAMSRVMQRMLQDVRKGGDELKKYAQVAGLSAQAFAQAFDADPIQALTLFIDGLGAINAAGGNVYAILEELDLSDIRITDTLLRMTGAQGQLEINITRANKAWEENLALQREAQQRYDTTESRIKKAQNSIREAGIAVGDAFLPTIGQAADAVAQLANKFAELDEGAKGNILTGAGIAAAIGPGMLLLKGVIGLLSGPGGLAVAAGLAAAGIWGIHTAMKTEHDRKVMETTRDLFGQIELSTEQIQSIIAAGFGTPVIDTSRLETARSDAQKAYDQFRQLNGQLGSKLYTLSITKDTEGLKSLPGEVDGLIAAAEQSLASGREAMMTSLNQLFDPGEGEEFKLSTGKWFSGLELELQAKGKELRDAVKDAFAGDGTPDPKDMERIMRLQQQLFEIAQKAAMVDQQSREDVFKTRAGMTDLSAQSILGLEAERQRMKEEMQREAETLFNDALYQAAKMKNSGYYDPELFGSVDEQYNALVAQAKEAYGQKDTRILMRSLSVAKEAYFDKGIDPYVNDMNRLYELYNKYGTFRDIGEFTKRIQESGESFTDKDMAALLQERERLQLSMDSAKAFVTAYADIYDDLLKLQGLLASQGIKLSPEHQEMLERYELLQAFSKAGSDSDRNPEKFMYLAKQQGQKDGQAYQEGFDQGRQETEQTEEPPAQTPWVPVPDEEVDALQLPPISMDHAAEQGRAAIRTVQEAMEDEEVAALQLPKIDKNHAAKQGREAVQAANEGAQEEPATIGKHLQAPAGIQESYRVAGRNAVDGFVNEIYTGYAKALAAGRRLGSGALLGVNETLLIRSPSKKMEESGRETIQGFVGPILTGRDTVYHALVDVGNYALRAVHLTNRNIEDAYTRGAVNEYLNPAPVTPVTPLTIRTPDNRLQNLATKSYDSSGGGGKSGPNADILTRLQEQQEKALQAYEEQREYLLQLSGAHRAYYDKTELDRQIDAVQEKYDQLMKAEQQGFDALSEKERSKRSEAHAKLMEQLQTNQADEITQIKDNYDLQRRLATDWLRAQADFLSAEFAAKQEAARAEDYDKEIADLEKRIRQTRSARERRELTEELERRQRNEGLRLEQLALQEALSGFGALQQAVSAGVIGLGDLTQDRRLPASAFGAGIQYVQDATAQQLQSALKTLANRAETGGNHYTIDLSGAVIRDEDDILRIADAFETRMRSIARDLA